MKGQLKASISAEYIAQLDEPCKSDIAALDALIRRHAPKLVPFISAGILAYGPRHYKYASGREGDWFRIGVASNQNYISPYICGGDGKDTSPSVTRRPCRKANIRRCCVRFKRLGDLDAAVLKKLIRECGKAAAKA